MQQNRTAIYLGVGEPITTRFHACCGNKSQDIKGTHTIYFSSSLYIINQKPMIPRTHFHCITTWVARSSG